VSLPPPEFLHDLPALFSSETFAAGGNIAVFSGDSVDEGDEPFPFAHIGPVPRFSNGMHLTNLRAQMDCFQESVTHGWAIWPNVMMDRHCLATCAAGSMFVPQFRQCDSIRRLDGRKSGSYGQ
jgi:hypothetical protein